MHAFRFIRAFCIAVLVILLSSRGCLAGVRHFGFIYEAPTTSAGAFELENSVTWDRFSNPEGADNVAFRHEVELGLTNRLQASIYFVDWEWSRDAHQSGARYIDSAVELIYNFSNPVIDPIGLSAYQELRIGDELIEWESKVIAQKNFGPLILAYNATLEAVWQGADRNEREGEFSNAIGVSYEISPRFSAGVELLHEFVFPEWRDGQRIRNVFVGPNVCYRQSRWFLTVAALAQATDTSGEADVQVRAIAGFDL